MGNASHERVVSALFCARSGLRLTRLKRAVSDKSWQKAAETIEGSARCIGVWRVCKAAASGEKLRRIVLAACRAYDLEALENDIDETNAFIDRLLADPPASAREQVQGDFRGVASRAKVSVFGILLLQLPQQRPGAWFRRHRISTAIAAGAKGWSRRGHASSVNALEWALRITDDGPELFHLVVGIPTSPSSEPC